MAETTRVVLSVSGSDRPGLTSALAEAVLAAGGNWKEGHLSRLGGLYVGSVLVELPDANVDELQRQVQAIDAVGLSIVINSAGVDPAGGSGTLLFELIGQDRPGIIREVSSVLAGLGVNIESLSSGEETGAWGGERLFRAKIMATLPDEMLPEAVQEALESISNEIMVDFTFAAAGN